MVTRNCKYLNRAEEVGGKLILAGRQLSWEDCNQVLSTENPMETRSNLEIAAQDMCFLPKKDQIMKFDDIGVQGPSGPRLLVGGPSGRMTHAGNRQTLNNPVVLTPADLRQLFLLPRYGQKSNKSQNFTEIQKYNQTDRVQELLIPVLDVLCINVIYSYIYCPCFRLSFLTFIQYCTLCSSEVVRSCWSKCDELIPFEFDITPCYTQPSANKIAKLQIQNLKFQIQN